jgi:hypothetical protein
MVAVDGTRIGKVLYVDAIDCPTEVKLSQDQSARYSDRATEFERARS